MIEPRFENLMSVDELYSENILVLSNYFYPEPTGSAPPITDLSFWLAENGLHPQVLTARPSYPKNAVYAGYEKGQRDFEQISGADVRRVKSFVARSRGVVGRLLSETSFALSAALNRTRKYKGVVCVCPSVFAVLVAPLFVEKGGRLTAIVHDIQSGLASSLKFGVVGILAVALRRLEAWALNRCDVVIALTPAMAKELREIGVKSRIEIVPPQVDVKEIQPRKGSDEDIPLLVYSGNLGKKQGLDQILDLARELKVRKSTCRILIRGEGSERAELESYALSENLDNISFSDLAPREKLSVAMGDATIHLVPQNPGGANFALPSKIFSIMAAERPYVATAQAGSPLYDVTEAAGAGVCVPPNNPQAFAGAIEALLRTPALRTKLAKSGRHYATTVVDREVVCRRILDILEGRDLG